MGAPSSVIPGERANVPLDGAIEEMLYPVTGQFRLTKFKRHICRDVS